MSGFMFLLVIGWVMMMNRNTTKDNNTGIRWQTMSQLEVHRRHSPFIYQSHTDAAASHAKQVGLKINGRQRPKTMRKKGDAVKLEEKSIEEVEEFPYLGAIVSNEGDGGRDMSSRINKATVAFTGLSDLGATS